MKKLLALLAALALAFISTAALSATLKGVEMKDSLDLDGKKLVLQGLGVRKKFFVSVYVGGLYLTTPTKDAAAALSADEPKRIALSFLREVDAEKIREAFKEGLEHNSPEALKAIGTKIDSFLALFRSEFREGDLLSVTYTPDGGTVVVKGESVLGRVYGADFMKALFSIWLGKNPPSEDLKKGMMGE
jgi:hypothetical protein